MQFFFGSVSAIAILLILAATSDTDTVGRVTERGFYTYEGQLYVVRPATPAESAV